MRSFIFTRRYCPISSYEPITDSDTALILYLGREVLDSRTFDNRFKRQQLQLQPKKDGIPKTTLDDQLKIGNEVVPLPAEDEFEAARVKFQAARDASTKTNPLVKQALLPASERAARRTAEKVRRDKVPSPMLGSPPPVARPTAMHGRCDNVLSPMLASPASRVRLFSPSADSSLSRER
jgi:hypothetical protein